MQGSALSSCCLGLELVTATLWSYLYPLISTRAWQMPLVIPPRSPKSQTKGDRIGCYIKNVYSNGRIKLTWDKSEIEVKQKKIEDLSLSNLARINVYNDLPQAKRNPWISISPLMQPCSAASSPLCTDVTEFCDAILLWAYACVSVRTLRACWC